MAAVWRWSIPRRTYDCVSILPTGSISAHRYGCRFSSFPPVPSQHTQVRLSFPSFPAGSIPAHRYGSRTFPAHVRGRYLAERARPAAPHRYSSPPAPPTPHPTPHRPLAPSAAVPRSECGSGPRAGLEPPAGPLLRAHGSLPCAARASGGGCLCGAAVQRLPGLAAPDRAGSAGDRESCTGCSVRSGFGHSLEKKREPRLLCAGLVFSPEQISSLGAWRLLLRVLLWSFTPASLQVVAWKTSMTAFLPHLFTFCISLFDLFLLLCQNPSVESLFCVSEKLWVSNPWQCSRPG